MPDIDKYSRTALENNTNVIQRLKTYVREEKNYGVTHIKYNFAGNGLAYALVLPSALIAECIDWDYHAYFDTDTGELLGTTQNDAAVKANQKAIAYIQRGQFAQARTAFSKAYQLCESGYSSEKSYSNSRDAAEIAAQAQAANDRGDYALAARKFKEAYDLSSVSDVYKKFNECRATAEVAAEKAEKKRQRRIAEEAERQRLAAIQRKKDEKNRKATQFYRDGLQYFRQQQYELAQSSFLNAYETCTSGYSEEQEFHRNYKMAKEKINEIAEAKRRAEEAEAARLRKLAEEEKRKNEKNKAADQCYRDGKNHWTNGRYEEARRSFQKAYETCADGYSEENLFLENCKMVEDKIKSIAEEKKRAAEAEAKRKREEAAAAKAKADADERRRLEEAERKRIEAEEKIRIEQEKRIQAQNQKATDFDNEGHKFWKTGKFEEALNAYTKAVETCASDCTERGRFMRNVNIAKEKLASVAEDKRLAALAEEKEQRRLAEEQKQIDARNKQANEFDKEGHTHWKNGQFELALNFFTKAYEACAENYSERARFYKNAQLAKEKAKEVADQMKKAAEEEARVAAENLKIQAEQERQRKVAEEKARQDELERQRIDEENKKNAAREEEEKRKMEAKLKLADERRQKVALEWQILAKIASAKSMKLTQDWQEVVGDAVQMSEKQKKAEKWQKFATKKVQQVKDSWPELVQEVQKQSKDAKRAEQLFGEGKKCWDEGWTAEENQEAELAAAKFDEAFKIFQECTKYVSKSGEDYVEMAKLKIEGNENFNKGLDYQDEGNEIEDDQLMIKKYGEALKSFDEARQSFNRVLEKGEKRFESSKKFVEDCLRELRATIFAVENRQLNQALQQLKYINKGQEVGNHDVDSTVQQDHQVQSFQLS